MYVITSFIFSWNTSKHCKTFHSNFLLTMQNKNYSFNLINKKQDVNYFLAEIKAFLRSSVCIISILLKYSFFSCFGGPGLKIPQPKLNQSATSFEE